MKFNFFSRLNAVNGLFIRRRSHLYSISIMMHNSTYELSVHLVDSYCTYICITVFINMLYFMLYDWCEPDQAPHVVIYMLLLNRYVCLLFVCSVQETRNQVSDVAFFSESSLRWCILFLLLFLSMFILQCKRPELSPRQCILFYYF